jgi:hypothetical protein
MARIRQTAFSRDLQWYFFTSKAVWPEKRQNGLGDLRFSKAAHLETGEPLVIAD